MIDQTIFSAVMTPGIALLILSTTMRLGNNRAAIIEYARLLGEGSQNCNRTKQLLHRRSILLGQGLQLLYLSLLVLIGEALLRACLSLLVGYTLPFAVSSFLVIIGFIKVFLALILLFIESRYAAQSMILMADELVNFQRHN